MKYLTYFICFLMFNPSFAQTYQAKEDVILLPGGNRISSEGLTDLEKDTLRKGTIPHALIQKWEQIGKRNQIIQDSILKTRIGERVPDFDAKDVIVSDNATTEGYPHRPSMYQGRVLIIHFWNFWDNSFRNEIPVLNAIVEKYRQDGVEVLSFTDVKIGESERQYLKENPIHFPLVENSWKFADEFLSMQIWRPYIIIVDKYGKMRFFYKHKDLVKIESNINEKYSEIKQPTYDFEEKIRQLLRGL